MGEKDVNIFMKHLKKDSYPYSSKPEELGDLLRKNEEWRKKSLVEKLDYYEKNAGENSEGYNSLIEGGFKNPILNVLPRYIEIEKLDYKNRELKIVLHESDSIKSLDGKILYTETKLIFESDYKQLLKDYPCVRKVISGIEKKGIKIVYDRKDMRIGTKAA